MSSLLKVSEAASLALHAMRLMAAKSDRPVSTKEIASGMRASEAHLAKVLQRLTRVGLVSSRRGPKGGFMLEKPSDQITLMEIYEAIEGPLSRSKCLFTTPICGRGKCMFGTLLVRVGKQVREYLARTRLSELTGRSGDRHAKA